MMTRHVLLSATMVLICAATNPVYAEDQASTNPSGTWAWSYDYGQGEVNSVLTLQAKDTLVTGVFYGEKDQIEIQDGKFDGKQVTFQLGVVRDGQTVTVSFTGVPNGDDITGTLSALVEGQAHEFPWKAKRSTRPEDVVGVWKLTIKGNDGRTYEPEVKIEQAESKLSGKYLSKEVGDHDLKAVMLMDNLLTFSVSISRDGRTFTFEYAGKPRGNQLAGEIKYDLDGNTGAAPFTGSLTPPEAQ